MIGDVITLNPEFFETAHAAFSFIHTYKQSLPPHQKICISIAGESGSGKTIAALCLSEILNQHFIPNRILHQDDYFFLPPASNHQQRLDSLSNVGVHEVNLLLLQSHILNFFENQPVIFKPIVDYPKNTIYQEEMSFEGVKVLIVEGTYTTLLQKVDLKFFCEKTYKETLTQRLSRARDVIDAFSDKVLEIEHQILSTHKPMADVFIKSDYSVVKNDAKTAM